jgi:hypothetical protein
VEETWVLLAVGGVGAGCSCDDAAGGEPAEDPVDDPDHADDDQQRRLEDVAEHECQHADQDGEQEQQPERAPPVGADLLLKRHCCANETTGASRSSVPKNSRSRKPKGFAISTGGKLCMTVW